MKPLFAHAKRAYAHYAERHGSLLAAAVTYFAFLSLFPLLALAFAAVGLLSAVVPGAERLFDDVLQGILPGMVGNRPNQISLDAVQKAAGAVAGIGALSVAYSGLGWVSEMRDALASMFDVESLRKPTMRESKVATYLKAQVRDVVALVGIGLVLLVSVGVSGGLLALLERAPGLVGFSDGLGVVAPVVLIALGAASGTVLFFAMFKFLAEPEPPTRALLSGALLGGLAFEMLKQASTLLLGFTAKSPAFQAFGIALILLVWIYYFSRIVMFSASWASTTEPPENTEPANDEPAGNHP